jgi:protein-tyrosine phosphatase
MSFSFLKRKHPLLDQSTRSQSARSAFPVDVHTHVLPGLDNGPPSAEEAIALLHQMSNDGVRKVIVTPHIMGDFYRNTSYTIQHAKEQVMRIVRQKGIQIEIETAAEYYLDASFLAHLRDEKPLLTFGEKYVLFETSLIGLPTILGEAATLLLKRGYVPVLAHPERYHYLQTDFDLAKILHQQGILFQLNLTSLQTHHAATRTLAEQLIRAGLVGLVGSNTHHQRDWCNARDALKSPLYALAVENGLLNDKL